MAVDDRTSNISKPLNDAYTGMLAISLLALIGGCVLLFLDYQNYHDQKVPTISREPTVAPTKRTPEADAPPKNEDKKDAVPEKKDNDKKKNADDGG